MSRPISLFSVSAILILAIDDGSRILTKYYSNPHPPQGQTDYPGQIAYKTVKDQKSFEKGLLGAQISICGMLSWSDRHTEKTAKQTTDIILYDQKVIVFKMESDVMLYVVGGPEENEVLLYRYCIRQQACRSTYANLFPVLSWHYETRSISSSSEYETVFLKP